MQYLRKFKTFFLIHTNYDNYKITIRYFPGVVLIAAAQQVGLPQEFIHNIPQHISAGSVSLQHSDGLTIHDSTCSWRQYYPVLSFLMSEHLHSEYQRLGGLLGLPPCSSNQWSRIVKRLEGFVTDLAEWSCSQVQMK